jgi:hypothetical protein
MTDFAYQRCRSLNNFSTMAALVAALNSPPIRRLKRTWDQVSARLIAVLDDVEKTFQASFMLIVGPVEGHSLKLFHSVL